ncbi:IS4 family transposase [Deinococcus aluminii]|uniref:Transposase for transposon Tn5 n=1 Tax=Deinococcus aluminii TaxID=1656885 RepID=A0ABP9XEL4_9DEIO
MSRVLHPYAPNDWATLHFGGASLGDKRRTERLLDIGRTIAQTPGDSLPSLFSNWSHLKGVYRFFDCPDVTPEKVQATHRRQVHEEMREVGAAGKLRPVLLLEDTTDLSYRRRTSISDLEPAGDRLSAKMQGFKMHSVFAVRQTEAKVSGKERHAVEVLGLAHQEFHTTKARPVEEREMEKKSKGAAQRMAALRERESRLWIRSGATLGDAPSNPTVRWVRVADRGADIYEYLQDCQRRHHGFVVRSSHDRLIVNPSNREPEGHVQTHARTLQALGQFDLKLNARPPRKNRPATPARTARLSVSAARVCLASPRRTGKKLNGGEPIPCSVVRVWEPHPPEGIPPLEWFLLCDQPVETFEAARECAQQYATRWVIEEFHKALKTGLGAENIQLESGKRLMTAVAVMAVVAVRLVALRELILAEPDAPAERIGLSSLALTVLSARLDRPLPTVRAAVMGLGQLGGHLGRVRDGFPGWLTLYRGWRKLSELTQGVELARRERELLGERRARPAPEPISSRPVQSPGMSPPKRPQSPPSGLLRILSSPESTASSSRLLSPLFRDRELLLM